MWSTLTVEDREKTCADRVCDAYQNCRSSGYAALRLQIERSGQDQDRYECDGSQLIHAWS